MSDQDKIASILAAIQVDSVLLAMLRVVVANNLPNVPSMQLDAIRSVLGLS